MGRELLAGTFALIGVSFFALPALWVWFLTPVLLDVVLSWSFGLLEGGGGSLKGSFKFKNVLKGTSPQKMSLLERVRLPNTRPVGTVRRTGAEDTVDSPSKEPRGFSNRERFRTAFRMKAYTLRQSSEDAGALADLEERGFPADILMEETIPALKLVIRAIRIMQFLLNKKRFKETLRPYDVKDVIEQYSAGHLDMLCRIKYLQTRIDMILAPGPPSTPKSKKHRSHFQLPSQPVAQSKYQPTNPQVKSKYQPTNPQVKFKYQPTNPQVKFKYQPTNPQVKFKYQPTNRRVKSKSLSLKHETYLPKATSLQDSEDQSMMGRFVRVERQVEDMEKKLDFLVDMHIQHSEQLQDPLGKGHQNYGKDRKRSRDHSNSTRPSQHLAPIPTYTERPTVLPISSLQDVSGLAGRTSGEAGRRNESPLSLLSVNHDELERSPSGFSISAERECEEDQPGEVSVDPGLNWNRQRPSYLAEGETDTDTDPFTPSGGPLPMSSTGEGFGEAVWSTPP
ncbi:hypothetical protein WMY93_000020 [Mugilogobius chulae]|uniref:Potassium channel voltage dependent KCNQ C-terminal domain-containing protein n=1 Tax=Mugilogobius chulae TaxID=88201 RepID=A0AAW0Q8V9_9GOBI